MKRDQKEIEQLQEYLENENFLLPPGEKMMCSTMQQKIVLQLFQATIIKSMSFLIKKHKQ